MPFFDAFHCTTFALLTVLEGSLLRQYFSYTDLQNAPCLDPFSRLELVVDGQVAVAPFRLEVLGQVTDVKLLVLKHLKTQSVTKRITINLMDILKVKVP